MLPGPGSLLAIAAEITLADSIPWAVRPLKMVPAANSSLMWMVLLSPDGGEQDDVGFRDGLGERGAHPDPQVGICVTSELIHRTALPGLYGNPQFTFGCSVKICTRMPPDLMSDRDRSPMLFFQNIASRCVLDRRGGRTPDNRRPHFLSGTGPQPSGPISPPA